ERELRVAEANDVVGAEHMLVALLAVHLERLAVACYRVARPVEDDVQRALRHARIVDLNVVVRPAPDAGDALDQVEVANPSVRSTHDEVGHSGYLRSAKQVPRSTHRRPGRCTAARIRRAAG